MKLTYSFPALFLIVFLISGFLSPTTGGTSASEYLPGRIIVKVEDDHTFFKQKKGSEEKNNKITPQQNVTGAREDGPAARVAGYLQVVGLKDMKPVFQAGASSRIIRYKRAGSRPDRLQKLAEGFENTYFISYTSGEDPLEIAEKISNLPGVIYAEPHYVHETTSTVIPNDSLIGATGHDYFEYQNFFRAWGVTTGSPDVVIAIVDSGVYYEHPDLINKLWYNPEPSRADEYFSWEIKNDTIGWNFWESGNVFAGEDPVQNANPVGNYSTHGTHVAGTAAADTDNRKGIAGTGFNARFMPVKTGGTKEYPRTIAYGFHGILYAAINEADVINCSFGSTGFSEFGQDVISFAIASGSVVVAAAGNNGNDVPFYPGAYDDVLTVGSVTRNYDDVISSFSTFGYFVDVFAMGERLLSTTFDFDDEGEEISWTPTYSLNTGTSMATPVVSGLAALIKAENPDWSPQRIANQIRTNARSIRESNPRDIFENRLGKGLVDAHAALVNPNPGLRITAFEFENEQGQKLNTGESGTLTLQGINYGEPTPSARIELKAYQTGITIEQKTQVTNAIDTDETFSITFEVDISTDYRLDEIPLFRLDMSDELANYSDFFMIEYETLLFDNLDINNLMVSVSSDGTIGFMDSFSSSGGIGFIPKNYENVLFEGGLMITAEMIDDALRIAEPVVINQIRDSTDITRHFLPVDNYRLTRSGMLSDLDGRAAFESKKHPLANELSIEMKTHAFTKPELAQSFLITYSITNESLATFEDMHVGLFNDWDIRDPYNDRTGFVEEDSLIYAYDPAGAPYVAVGHLGPVSSAFAIDNTSSMSLITARSREDSLRFGIYYQTGRLIYDGFTDAEKRLALTSGTERTTVTGTDISIVTGSGPFTLLPFASIDVGFVYAWGEDLEDLRSQVAAARDLEIFKFSTPGVYSPRKEIADRATIYQNFPNPFNTTTTIEFHLSDPGPVELAVYNVLGQRVATLVDANLKNRIQFVSFDASGLASGVYIAVLRAEGRTETMKMSFVK